MDSEVAKAYTEVVEILKYIPIDYLEKIPKEKIEFYKALMDSSYEFKIDEEIDLQNLNISTKAKAVISNLYKDYWATPEEKVKILEYERFEYDLLEQEKRKKYKTDNIFKNTNKKETAIIEYKEEKTKWYIKLIIWINKFFKK